jgi:hypothetical protein
MTREMSDAELEEFWQENQWSQDQRDRFSQLKDHRQEYQEQLRLLNRSSQSIVLIRRPFLKRLRNAYRVYRNYGLSHFRAAVGARTLSRS